MSGRADSLNGDEIWKVGDGSRDGGRMWERRGWGGRFHMYLQIKNIQYIPKPNNLYFNMLIGLVARECVIVYDSLMLTLKGTMTLSNNVSPTGRSAWKYTWNKYINEKILPSLKY